jgi:hypothetical protein
MLLFSKLSLLFFLKRSEPKVCEADDPIAYRRRRRLGYGI